MKIEICAYVKNENNSIHVVVFCLFLDIPSLTQERVISPNLNFSC